MPEFIAEAVLAAVEPVVAAFVGAKLEDAAEPSGTRVSVAPSARSRPGTARVNEISITWYIEVGTPIGTLVVASEDDAITGVYMESHRHGPVDRDDWLPDVHGVRPVLRAARTQLGEYFTGQRSGVDLKLRARGTDMQQSVWRALVDIPFGETRSYGEIAASIGNPKASRAVGAANGRNPISIIVPCHRVIGANGSLTGFGGGIERKEWLLAHEARVSGRESPYGRRDLFGGVGAFGT